MSPPLISIIIATFDSEKKLPLVLESIKNQDFQNEKLEILIADGGSSDQTIKIAKKYNARIIKNSKIEPVYAKYLGLREANGKYVMYLDHDEVLENNKSLKNKLKALFANKDAFMIAGGNYKSPPGYSFINDYINDFGDPFSFFVYRLSKSNVYFEKSMKVKYKVLKETSDYTIFEMNTNDLSIFEMVAGASMFDRLKFFESLGRHKLTPENITHIFYHLRKISPELIVMKNDAVIHYSSESVRGYFRKVSWRVKNNIYFKSTMGLSGFSGRSVYHTQNWKKYLFVPYALSLAMPAIDALILSFTRKNFRYLWHVVFTLFTAIEILFHTVLYVFGYSPALTNYGGSEKIS